MKPISPAPVRRLPLVVLIATALVLIGGRAWAHHPMGGAEPSTFAEALLSGLAHPFLDYEHAAFLIAFALLVSALETYFRVGALLVGASVVGLVAAASLAMATTGPTLVALSLVLVAVCLFRTSIGPRLALALALAGGVVHGFGYAESVAGGPTAVLAGYALGLVVTQVGLLVGIGAVVQRIPAAGRELGNRILGVGCLLAAASLFA